MDVVVDVVGEVVIEVQVVSVISFAGKNIKSAKWSCGREVVVVVVEVVVVYLVAKMVVGKWIGCRCGQAMGLGSVLLVVS